MSDNREYKGFITNLGIRAQAVGIPTQLSSPAWLTHSVEKLAKRKDPKMVESFIKKYGIDYARADRCGANNSVGTCAKKYTSLDDFFTRKVRGITVNANADVVSPADCRMVLFDDFPGSGVWVKGKKWSASRLLKNSSVSDHHIGAVGIFRLRPVDYHRFHTPVSGTVQSVKIIKGKYLSVDPTVVHGRNVFTENTRAVVKIQTDFGPVYVIAVGAAGVGKVHIFPQAGESVTAGEELGMFSFGGSTVVVLLPAGMAWNNPTSVEIPGKVGQKLI